MAGPGENGPGSQPQPKKGRPHYSGRREKEQGAPGTKGSRRSLGRL